MNGNRINLNMLAIVLSCIAIAISITMSLKGEDADPCLVGEEFYSHGEFREGIFLYMQVPRESVGWYPQLPVYFAETHLGISANLFAQQYSTVECAKEDYGRFADREFLWPLEVPR
jgi:hypothetical protein